MADSPAPRSRWLRRGLAVLGKILGALVLLAIFAVIIREQIPWALGDAGVDERWQRIALTAVTGVALLLGLRHWFRRPKLVGRAFVCFAVGTVAVWLWLAWDDPKLDFPPEDYLTGADSPEAEATHALVLRYRSGEDSRLPANLPNLREPSARLGDPAPTKEQWTTFFIEHRAEIQHGWEQLADHRAWFAEMADAPKLADLISSLSDPIPSFRDLRAPARFMTWQACALALEGRGDEALAEVTTLLTVSQKLGPESRTLVRGMIAIVLQKMAIQTADFVLSTTKTSAESRARLLAVLTARQNPVDGARQLIWADYPISARALLTMGSQPADDSLQSQWPYARRIFLNPKATANLFGNYFDTLAHHAAARDFGAMQTQQAITFDEPRSWRIKNMAGYLFLDMATPAFSKVSENFWQTEDLAVALEARLRAP